MKLRIKASYPPYRREDVIEALREAYMETGVNVKDLLDILFLIHNERKIEWIPFPIEMDDDDDNFKIFRSKKKNNPNKKGKEVKVMITPFIQKIMDSRLEHQIKMLSSLSVMDRSKKCRRFTNSVWRKYSHTAVSRNDRLFLKIEGSPDVDILRLLTVANHDEFQRDEEAFAKQLDNMSADIPFDTFKY